jgi:hypothetical protein
LLALLLFIDRLGRLLDVADQCADGDIFENKLEHVGREANDGFKQSLQRGMEERELDRHDAEGFHGVAMLFLLHPLRDVFECFWGKIR